MSDSKKLHSLIEKTILNIEEDRGVANKLLTDLIIYMAKTGDSAHQTVGHVAAQYLETLQRSNEQLVKVTSIMQKEENTSKGFSKKDMDDIFNVIKDK